MPLSTASSWPDVADARRIAGFLDVHAEVDDVGDDLRVGLRLVVAAHHAERHHRAPVLREHRRHQRVQRPLVRADLVRMTRLQRESRAAVVQRDAGVAGHEAGAEAAEERLDERDHVAVAVRRRQVDRVAAIDAGEVRCVVLAAALVMSISRRRDAA